MAQEVCCPLVPALAVAGKERSGPPRRARRKEEGREEEERGRRRGKSSGRRRSRRASRASSRPRSPRNPTPRRPDDASEVLLGNRRPDEAWWWSISRRERDPSPAATSPSPSLSFRFQRPPFAQRSPSVHPNALGAGRDGGGRDPSFSSLRAPSLRARARAKGRRRRGGGAMAPSRALARHRHHHQRSWRAATKNPSMMGATKNAHTPQCHRRQHLHPR
jgi:hypothetical protein